MVPLAESPLFHLLFICLIIVGIPFFFFFPFSRFIAKFFLPNLSFDLIVFVVVVIAIIVHGSF